MVVAGVEIVADVLEGQNDTAVVVVALELYETVRVASEALAAVAVGFVRTCVG